MENQVKRIGVLTSGGDAPGMNAAVRAVVRTALSNGVECVGIRRGWNGLINSDFVRMTSASVSHIIDKGGTILFTARSKEFMTEDGRAQALSTCKLLGLDGIVAIGGDGTFKGALALSRQAAEAGSHLSVVGIPATIDNDIGCSHYTIGFDTACNTAIECIDKLRDTMQSHERCSVVEVMGRHAGHLALYVGISNYKPEQARRAIAILRENHTPCLIHQARYSMFDRWVEPELLSLLQEEGVGLIAFSPLAQGLLTNRYLHGIPDDSRAARPTGHLKREVITPERMSQINRLNDIASQRGQTLAEMALAWLLRDNRVTSVLIGASSVEQLKDNLRAQENTIFTDEELKNIGTIINE